MGMLLRRHYEQIKEPPKVVEEPKVKKKPTTRRKKGDGANV